MHDKLEEEHLTLKLKLFNEEEDKREKLEEEQEMMMSYRDER